MNKDEFRNVFLNHDIHSSVIVASTFRSGSTFVSELLAKNGAPGLGQERFNIIGGDSCPDLRTYMSNMLAPFRGSQFPTKIMWPHRNNLARVLGISRANSSQFSGLFPDAKWIHVYRDDIFMQAISMWRAKKSGRWHVYARDQSSEPAIEYDFDAIDDCIWELALHNRLWQDFFTISGIVPYEVNYEAIVNDVKLVLVPLLDHLGLDSSNPVIYVPLRKQGDDLTREFRDRLMEDLFRIGR